MKLPGKLQGKVWHTDEGSIDTADPERVLEAIASGAPRATAIPGVFGNSDRRVDRATQLLRKAGLIEHVGGKWRVVDGRNA